MTTANLLKKLQRECQNCRKCDIGGIKIDDKYLSNVFSNMCVRAKIMVIGQNPGFQEVKLERPFVGPSGEFFNKALKDVLGIDRSLVYVANTVRCYTPGNRSPSSQEQENCCYFLDKEIEIIKPHLIVTLGNPALKAMTGISGINKCHGEIQMSLRYKLPVLPLFHPSPLNMNRKELRETFYKDLEVMRAYL